MRVEMRRPERAQDSPVYESRTREIIVRVIVSYLPQQSEPERSTYQWAYMVEIENHGSETVQLVSRAWVITDARNRVQLVNGPGVVGEQPVLKPGTAFRYTSGCPLQTSSGTMRGHYQMVTDAGDPFEVQIPEFSLHLPLARKRLN